jgi:predicted O-methyltransferase YrrM
MGMTKSHNASSKLNLLKYPIEAFQYFTSSKAPFHNQMILNAAKKLLGEKFVKSQWVEAINEVENKDFVLPNVRQSIAAGNNINTLLGKWLYCTVRISKPEILIETGIAHGNSSWVILNAIKKNGKGTLYSFDLPNNDTNAAYNFENKKTETGWMVHEELRINWNMVIGDSLETLPKTLASLSKVDFFFHDSDHSYKHMMFEFETVFPFLRNGGILSSDDINKNSSFQDFVEAKKINSIFFTKGGSAIKS